MSSLWCPPILKNHTIDIVKDLGSRVHEIYFSEIIAQWIINEVINEFPFIKLQTWANEKYI